MATKTNADGSVTVELKFPVKGPEGELKELTLRRLKGKEIRKVNLRDLVKGDEMLKVIQSLAGIQAFIADQIDGEDFVVLSEVVNGFFGTAPRTGEE